ncbi:MAG: hypothetical protein ACD_58C00285G0001 [uncultured bacterium]|nr:MAG: hypothetical protein ACD_58C00285G0001 [uncultured bacterium]
MKIFKTKSKKIAGSDFHEVHQTANKLYMQIKRKTKRRAYIRSAYFDKNKVFLDLFWHHLFKKENWRDRVRRMKYYACAIELIKKSHFQPSSKENPNRRSEILHRFYGVTADDELFCVQVKEDKKKDQKFLISVFPIDENYNINECKTKKTLR